MLKVKENKIKSFITKNKYIIIVISILTLGLISALLVWQLQNMNTGTLRYSDGISEVDETPVSQSEIDSYKVAADKPRLLIINNIDVRARIFPVGLTPENAIETANGIYDTGWYVGSAVPGQKGAAFIDGHVSGPNNKGVFTDLNKLKQGDEIIVEMGDGKINTFIVQKTEELALDKVDMANVLKPIDQDKPGLNLMTCSGKYDKSNDTFTNRLTVYSSMK